MKVSLHWYQSKEYRELHEITVWVRVTNEHVVNEVFEGNEWIVKIPYSGSYNIISKGSQWKNTIKHLMAALYTILFLIVSRKPRFAPVNQSLLQWFRVFLPSFGWPWKSVYSIIYFKRSSNARSMKETSKGKTFGKPSFAGPWKLFYFDWLIGLRPLYRYL